jgi:hypothetical protein
MAATTTSTFQPLTAIQSTRRIEEIDKNLKALRAEMKKLQQAGSVSPRWWHDHAGRFENDPVFDEIVRLGRATRTPSKRRAKGKRARS